MLFFKCELRHEEAADGAADGVETGSGDRFEGVDAPVEAQIAQKGEDKCFFEVDNLRVGDGDGGLRGVLLQEFYEVGVEGAAAGDEEGAEVVLPEHAGDLEGDVRGDGGEQVGGGEGRGLQQGPELGEEPLLAERLGGGLGIV